MMRLLWVCIALCAASAVFSGTDARYNPNLLRGLRAYPKVHQNAADTEIFYIPNVQNLPRELRQYPKGHQNAADNGGSKGGYVKGYRPEKEQLIYIGDGSGYGSGDGSGDNPDDEDSIHPEKGVEIGTGVLPWNPEFLGEGIVPEVTEVVQFVPVTSVNYQPKTEKPNFWSSAWNNVASAVDDIGDTLGDAASNVGDKVGNWGKEVGETFNEFGENVGNTFDDWGNKLADVADDINDKIGVVIDDAQDMAQEVWESLKQFGSLVADGGKYLYSKLEQITDQVRGSAIIQKLQNKLEQGDEQVAELLQSIGEKHGEWEQLQDQSNVEVAPNMFLDPKIQNELQRLVDAGTLTQEDFSIITQQQGQKGHIKVEKRVYNRRGWSDSVGEAFNDLGETLSDTGNNIGDTVGAWSNNVGNGAKVAAATVVDAVADVVGKRGYQAVSGPRYSSVSDQGYSDSSGHAEQRRLRYWLNSLKK